MITLRSLLVALLLFAAGIVHVHGAPAIFIENTGQWHSEVRFRLVLDQVILWITDRGAVVDIVENCSAVTPLDSADLSELPALPSLWRQPERVAGRVLRYEFYGATNIARAVGEGELEGRSTFLSSNAVDHGGRGCRSFHSIRLRNVCAGVDALFSLENGQPIVELLADRESDIVTTRILRLDGGDRPFTLTSAGRASSIAIRLGERLNLVSGSVYERDRDRLPDILTTRATPTFP